MHPQVSGLDYQCRLVIRSERSTKGGDQAQRILSFRHAVGIENEKKERMTLRYPKTRPVEWQPPLRVRRPESIPGRERRGSPSRRGRQSGTGPKLHQVSLLCAATPRVLLRTPKSTSQFCGHQDVDSARPLHSMCRNKSPAAHESTSCRRLRDQGISIGPDCET